MLGIEPKIGVAFPSSRVRIDPVPFFSVSVSLRETLSHAK